MKRMLFLVLLLLPISAWAICREKSICTSSLYFGSKKACAYESHTERRVNNCSSIDDIVSCLCSASYGICGESCGSGYYCETLGYGSGGVGVNPLSKYCGTEASGRTGICRYYLECSTQTDLDSALCVRDGKHWQNGQCNDVCKAEKDACSSYGGTWQPGASSDTECNGNCDICSGEPWKNTVEEAKKQCCALGFGVAKDPVLCWNDNPPWIGSHLSGFNLGSVCNYLGDAKFDSWCLQNAGDDTTQSSSSQSPNCFGAGCPSSSSMSSSSGEGGGGSSGEGGGGSSGEEESSSSEEGGGGSSGEEESSSSEEGGGGQGGNGKDTVYIGNGEDWEYNYYPELDTLIKYLKGVFGISRQLGDKIDSATEAIGSKIVQWEPKKLDSIIKAIKDGFSGLNIEGDSSGYWNGDSAIGGLWDSISGLSDRLTDTTGFGSLFYSDGDSALDSLQRFLDGGDSLYGALGGQLDSLGGSIGDAIQGLADSGAVGAFRDSLQAMADKFNYKRFTGSGGCPSFLNKKTTIKLGIYSAEIPPVGDLLCTTKISIFGRTPWEFGRALIRAIVAISCMLWLFKVATGATGGDDD